MKSKIKTRPVTEQSEQATAYTADERVDNSLTAQESDAPVSNCAAQDLQESGEGTSKPTAGMEQSESETLKAKVKAELDAGNPVPYEDFLSAGYRCIEHHKAHEEELQESENHDDFESFLSTLEDKYGFKLNNCQWMTTENLNIYWYENGQKTDGI